MQSHYTPPTASGIYRITCTITGKFYIGSAINLFIRWKNHRNELQRNEHGNQKLQRAWNKYGEQAFTFEVLELVLPMSLTAREQYWFSKLKPFGKRGFNIALIAGSQLGLKRSPKTCEKIGQAHRGSKHTPEACANMAQAHLGNKNTLGYKPPPETREKLRQANLGKKMSPEAIEKTRQASLGRKKSPEEIENHRLSMLGRIYDPEVYAKRRTAYILTSPDGTEYLVQNLKKFCQENHLNQTHLVQVAQGHARQSKGWTARYPESETSGLN